VAFFGEEPGSDPTKGLVIWEPYHGSTPKQIIFTNEIVTAAAFDPMGRTMAIATRRHSPDSAVLRAVDLEGTQPPVRLVPPRKLIAGQLIAHLAFSPDGHWLAAAYWDDTLAPGLAGLWHVVKTGSGFAEPESLPHLDGVLFTAFSDSSQMVATASEDQTANVWVRTNDTWQPSLRPFYCGGEVYLCSFSHNGQWLATANRTPEAQASKHWSSQVRIWDVANSEPVGLPVALPDRVTRLAFVANDARLFVERWVPPATPERWLIDLATDEGSAKDFLLRAELLSGQRSFLSGRAQHLPLALEGPISAEEALARATSVGPLRPLTKEDCRELWSRLSSNAGGEP
jgi:hypothetical protein